MEKKVKEDKITKKFSFSNFYEIQHFEDLNTFTLLYPHKDKKE